jgi:hypothetical protein
MDQSKKTMRHFYCRDALWETFEAMANDFDCSIDYLINESMRLYARSKNYTVPAGGPPSQIVSAANLPTGARPAPATPSTPGVRGTSSGYGTSPTLPPPARAGQPTAPRFSQTPPAPPAPPSNWSPPLAPAPPTTGTEPQAPPLYLWFQGQRMVVDKEQFVIGRGSKTADLAIKDGNISRQHAVVIRRNGVYYIKDLGSTNGIEYKGMRIDNKRIDEGDVFFICDYELRFTYQP